MKAKVFKGVSIVVVLLALVSCIILAGTMAKYTNTVTGTGSETVAKWDFTANDQKESVTIDLISGAGKLMPGTSGSFDIVLSNGGDVDVDYVITLAEATNAPRNMKFYKESTATADTKGDDLAISGTITGTLEASASDVTVTIFWDWAFETEGGDAADTADGEAAEEVSVKVTVVGTQKAAS